MEQRNIDPQRRVVIGIVQDAQGRFLVIERADDSPSLRYAFPGGKIEAGESDEAAVLREVFEETGARCTIDRKLGERIHPDTHRVIAYYLCRADSTQTPKACTGETRSVAFYDGATALSFFTTDVFVPVRDVLQPSAQPPARKPVP
mgnify:CR=1 FL=1